jgi:hypothetical protein
VTKGGTVFQPTSEEEARLLHTVEAARVLGVSESWLSKDRMREEPRVPFIKLGRAVRYHSGVVDSLRGGCDE